MTDILDHLAEIRQMLRDTGYKIASQNIAEAIATIVNLRTASVGADVGSRAARDVLAERERQLQEEGWSPRHDDSHVDGQIATAAAIYAIPEGASWRPFAEKRWPWHHTWFKRTTRRRDLVKAAALILAEIERLDRAEAATVGALVGSGAGRGAADA